MIKPTFDIRLTARQRRREQAYWEKTRRAEVQYGVQLRKVGRQVGDLVRGLLDDVLAGDDGALRRVVEALTRYSDAIHPWAASVAARMLADVARRDEAAWRTFARMMGREVHKEIASTPTGALMRQLQAEQIHYITSIPREAAARTQALVQEMLAGGRRYDEVRDMLLDTTGVAVNRATLIARTEVAKASATLTQARAVHIGSTGYIWRTARDADVRKEHRRLEGTFHRWDDPPVAEAQGQRHHPGEFPNCRCYSEPIIPDNL